MRNVLILGATSSVAQATARIYARDGHRLHLVARNAQRLDAVAEDMRVLGASVVKTTLQDLNVTESHSRLFSDVEKELGPVDHALIFHGTLADQKACEADFSHALRELETNALSTLSLLTHLANDMEKRGEGIIAVVTSVAGDRGRQSNYVYGAAKSTVNTFLEGLRNRLFKSGVRVITVKPGFIDTPMTSDFPKGPLWATPDTIARGILKAVNGSKDVIYLPGFWRVIMLIIRHVPEVIFKRLSL
ncbi:MAG: SDR family oxidoreductase [Magnetococcales bacterium]|nr:SDR family oxidoreductase [Magnetococcales bacterium]